MRRDGKREGRKKRREALVFIAWVSKRGVIMIAHWRERERGLGLAERERWGERRTIAERKRGMDGQHRKNRCPALFPFSSLLVAVSLYRQINIRLMWPAAAVATKQSPQSARDVTRLDAHLCTATPPDGSCKPGWTPGPGAKHETLLQSTSGFFRAHGARLIASKTVNSGSARLFVVVFFVRSAYVEFNHHVLQWLRHRTRIGADRHYRPRQPQPRRETGLPSPGGEK